jgi:hypothetical protein
MSYENDGFDQENQSANEIYLVECLRGSSEKDITIMPEGTSIAVTSIIEKESTSELLISTLNKITIK